MVAKGTEEDRQEAYRLYMGGMPISQIARKYDVTPETIRNWLKKVGQSKQAG